MYHDPERRIDPPEEREKPIAYICDFCGDEIYEGSEYWEIDGKIYCRECMEFFHHYSA